MHWGSANQDEESRYALYLNFKKPLDFKASLLWHLVTALSLSTTDLDAFHTYFKRKVPREHHQIHEK